MSGIFFFHKPKVKLIKLKFLNLRMKNSWQELVIWIFVIFIWTTHKISLFVCKKELYLLNFVETKLIFTNLWVKLSNLLFLNLRLKIFSTEVGDFNFNYKNLNDGQSFSFCLWKTQSYYLKRRFQNRHSGYTMIVKKMNNLLWIFYQK